MSALGVNRTCREGGNDANDPQETSAGQDFRDAKMNQCGQRLRDRSPRGRSQPEPGAAHRRAHECFREGYARCRSNMD